MSSYEKMIKKIDRIVNEVEALEFMCNDQELEEEIVDLKEKLLRLRRKALAKHNHLSKEVKMDGPNRRDLRSGHPISIYKDCIVIFGD